MKTGTKLTKTEKTQMSRLFVHEIVNRKTGELRVTGGTNITSANVALSVLHTLARKGLITYEESEAFAIFGARGWSLLVTPAGREVVDALVAERRAALEACK